MAETVTIREFTPDDAAGVAAMWNDSDQAWPGGWTGGIPETADDVRRREARSPKLALLLAMVGDRVAGYCRVTEYPTEPDAAYVALLNVAPQFHGRGLGRDLLKRSLDLTMQRGYRRLDLGTWAGNMKAVPLYKKTGFFWVPETSVDMQNYIPLILRQPLLAAYFADHDWYQTQVRDLSVKEDDIRIGGMRVYPYEWRAGSRHVRAVIDAAGRDLTELATERWRVACSVDDRRLYPGFPRRVRWVVERLAGPPLDVSLFARGTPGLHLRQEAAARVEERAEWEAELTSDLDLKAKEEHEPPHRVETTVLLDGRLLQLATAVKVEQPLGVQVVGLQPLAPGVCQTVSLRLRNQQEQTVQGDVTITGGEGLAVDGGSLTPVAIDLAAESYGGVSATLEPRRSGLLWLRAQPRLAESGAEPRLLKPIDLPLVSLGAGDVCAYIHEERVHLETAATSLTIAQRGGWWSLRDRVAGKGLADGQVVAGAPPNRALFRRVKFEVAVREESGTAVAVLRGSPPDMPSVLLELHYRLTAMGLLTVRASVQNTATEPLAIDVRFSGWCGLGQGRRVAAPLASGLVVDRAPEWPGWIRDERFERPEFLSETWFAMDEDGRVVGTLWSGADLAEVNGWGLPAITHKLTGVAGGATVEVPATHYVGGGGTWETVRSLYRQLIAADAPEELPAPRRALELTAAVAPALRPGAGALRLHSLYGRQQGATLGLKLPAGWTGGPMELPLEPVAFDTSVDVPLEVRHAVDRPCAATLAVTYQGEFVQREFQVPLLDLGQGRGVQVSSTNLGSSAALVVDNGMLRFTVAPGFSGSIVSLVADGRERLLSAFPEAREFMWWRPWFGGIHPLLRLHGSDWERFPDPGRLHEEQFAAEPLEGQGPDGRWAGVRLTVTPQDRRLRGVTLVYDYLTAPGSNVLALLADVRNLTSARLDPVVGFGLFQPGERAYNVTTASDPEYTLRSTPTQMEAGHGEWAGAADEEGGAVVMVSAERHLRAKAFGSTPYGVHLAAEGELRLNPGAGRVVRAYAVFCREEEVKAYGCLAKAVELP